MNSSVDTILKDVLHLTPDEREELIRRLSPVRLIHKEPGKVERLFGSIDSGDDRSCDNDRIDADLAKEYLDNHSGLDVHKTPGAVRKHFGTINSGDPRSADNDRIDADLVAAYMDNHQLKN